jgi:peptidoglycan hydrolase CwlO-like protein
MGFFDDLQKVVQSVTDDIDRVKRGTDAVVKKIDDLEEKVTNLPTEAQLKKKLKQRLKTSSAAINKKKK